MWRITNILLLIFLVFALGVGGYVFYDDYLSYLDWGQGAEEQRARTLNADEVVDEQGRRLRTQAVSFGETIGDDAWGPWSIVLVGQSALKEPVATDEIVVTGMRFSGALDQMEDYSSPVRASFTNNLVLRNDENGEQRILFSNKVAITNVLALGHQQFPGIVVAYSDADTNGDGKINGNDLKKLRLFRFDAGDAIDIPFDGLFSSFNNYPKGAAEFSFTSRLDLNGDGEINTNREPARLYEASVETGAVRKALSAATISKLQDILDAPVESE